MSTLPPFDPEYPRCRAHRDVPAGAVDASCPACGEARKWVQDRRQRAETAALAQLRGCGMCSASGQRWEPGTHRPVSPPTSCDHTTPHDQALAELVERERVEAAGRAAAAARRAESRPVSSTPAGRARARDLFVRRPRGGLTSGGAVA
jgi:hypothetical protein